MQEIKEELTERGNIVVSTSEDFSHEAGENWEDLRTHAIERAEYYIQLITQSLHNNRASDCWNELELALSSHLSKGRLIPVLYDGLDINNVVPQLDTQQAIRSETNLWQQRLVNRVARLISVD